MECTLRFEDLDVSNWEKYSEEVMRCESAFPEPIRSTKEDILFMLMSEKKVAKAAFVGNVCVGDVIGFLVEPQDFDYYGITGAPEGCSVIYLTNIVVNPNYQGHGYGTLLMREFINEARRKGFTMIAGHFRPKASLGTFKKFGGSEKMTFSNWDGTGEDFVLCYMNLAGMTQTVAVPA